MKQVEKAQQLGNKLVLTAIAFNNGINEFCNCKDLSTVSDKFDTLTSLMSAHTDVIEELMTVCPQALIELSQRGLSDLLNGISGGDT